MGVMVGGTMMNVVGVVTENEPQWLRDAKRKRLAVEHGLDPKECIGFHLSRCDHSGYGTTEESTHLFAVIPSLTRKIGTGHEDMDVGFFGNKFYQMEEPDPLLLYGFRKVIRAMRLKLGDAQLPQASSPELKEDPEKDV